ncbi:MAG: hypothetical protein LC779_11715 [Actinobacteria bacterium]|nr:hypothetical protein [Actinomycetota bacterium]
MRRVRVRSLAACLMIVSVLSACGDSGPTKAEQDTQREKQMRAAAVPILENAFDVVQPLQDALELAKKQPPVVGPFIDVAQHGLVVQVLAAQRMAFAALKPPASLKDSQRSMLAGFTELESAVGEMVTATKGPPAGVPLKVAVAEAKLDSARATYYRGARSLFPTDTPSLPGPNGGSASGRPRTRTRAGYLLAVGRTCDASDVQLGAVKGDDAAALKAAGDILSAGISLLLKEAPPPADAATVEATIAVPLRKATASFQQLLAVIAKPAGATEAGINTIVNAGVTATKSAAAGMGKYGSATCDRFFTAAAA